MAFHWLIGSNANEHFRDFLSVSLGFRIAESSGHIGHIEKAFHLHKINKKAMKI